MFGFKKGWVRQLIAGGGSDAVAGKSLSASHPVTIYYWPMHGRASACFRICDYGGIEYVHKSEFPEIASVGGAFGADSTCFAPPIIVDGAK